MLKVERGQGASCCRAPTLQTVSALASALESKVTRHACAFAARPELRARTRGRRRPGSLGCATRSTPYGFLLHDVGKIGIPDEILLKPGPLSPAERRKMETHTVLGEAMLSGCRVPEGEGLKIVRSHHERWDGRGYPDGLAGDEIPLGARIFAVADALDAMTSHRPYRQRLSWSAARDGDPRAAKTAVRSLTWSTPSSPPSRTCADPPRARGRLDRA